MTITIPDKTIKNKDIFDFIKANCENWLTEAKYFFDSKDVFSRNGWVRDVFNERVYNTKKLRYWGLLESGIVAKITYNGKRFNIKIMEIKGEIK